MFGVDDAISAVSGLADTVVKRIWPDATQVEKAKIAQVGQIEINKKEAESNKIYVAGWRPGSCFLWLQRSIPCYQHQFNHANFTRIAGNSRNAYF